MSSDDWLNETIATHRIDRVPPNMASAGERINDARRHITSARTLADTDPTLAIAACHDAARKAITAHMAASGLRPRSGEGAHRLVVEYARHELADVVSDADLESADNIRRDRATAEYGDFAHSKISAAHVLEAADVAQRIVDAVAATLAARGRG